MYDSTFALYVIPDRSADRRFWKVPWQTNTNLLNEWHLKFACAYLNTQESSPSGTPLKRLQDG
ncbi:hypothetical protein T09_7452 [Trichinella sp. T9]|nr:hypothetical protein T09_7452 [Trichinella sp. T9]